MSQGKSRKNLVTLFRLFRIDIHFAEEYAKKVGFLANLKPTTHVDSNGAEIAALLLYFIQENGDWFKAVKIFEPYFLVQCDEEVVK